MSTISPKRIDIIYSLIKGIDPGNYSRDSIGITFDGKADSQKIGRLATIHGFIAPDLDQVKRQSQPNCYVTLKEGVKLESILRSLISDPAISRINLNYTVF